MRRPPDGVEIRQKLGTALWSLVAVLAWGRVACAAPEPERLSLWVTSPWLTLMTRFVGGVYVEVHPLSGWNERGQLVRFKRPPAGARIIALDREEKRAFDLSSVSGARVRLLFSDMPYLRQGGAKNFLDPATMPFLGQQILKALAAFDHENYQYYQRRLAEFQSRLESTVGVGRQLLSDISLLNLSSELALWMAAAGNRHVTPSWEMTQSWERGERLEVFERTLTEAQAGHLFVIYDNQIPLSLRSALETHPSALLLVLPDVTQMEDLFLYLYDQYMAVWNFARHGPTPSRSSGTPRRF